MLAATLRDGVLYFQAAAPVKDQEDLAAISAFSGQEMSRHPETRAHDDNAAAALAEAIRSAASQRGTRLTELQ